MKLSLLVRVFVLMPVLFIQTARGAENRFDTLAPSLNNPLEDRVQKLLTTEPIFMENWINNVTFTYDNVRAVDLPEITTLPLLQAGETFSATWYGKLSSTYKWRWGRQHHGVDLGLKTGDPIYAAWDGIVRYAQWNKSGYGNCVVIRHKNGMETLYGHMSKLLVTPNQYVTSGEMIGLGGSTGRSSGPHLHFEIRYKDFSINPELIIDYSTRQLKLDTFQFVRANISGTRYSGDINASDPSAPVENKQTPAENTPLPEPVTPETWNAVDTVQKITAPVSIAKTTTISKKEPPAKTKPIPPKKKPTPPKKKAPTTYVIKKGDTFTSIAKKTGVSIATLKKLNPRQKETLLMPGKTIRIR